MKQLFFFLGLCLPLVAIAHSPENEHTIISETWHINGTSIQAYVLAIQSDYVIFQKENGQTFKVHPAALSALDREKILNKKFKIDQVNRNISVSHNSNTRTELGPKQGWVIFTGLTFSLVFLFAGPWLKREKHLSYLLWFTTPLLGFVYAVLPPPNTDPTLIDQSFDPYKPNVVTRWDQNYFYIESLGIPDHEMMTGITKWQQQVPIPQCYFGANAWQIPLKPELASTPVPVNPQHFIRGAVAIATNGVPIFNPYTNTGVDALIDGQLDNYGGHSGRADDYHYHIAPLHLDSITPEVLPIAWALDGFPVYGPYEPDGSPMRALDENHGHFEDNGSYHYHGTKTSPYMIGRMVGKVTEDNTMQIIPQPSAKPVRPSLTPLSGATITNFEKNPSSTGYTLTYTRNGGTYQVSYSWTNAGKYTYIFTGPSGTTTESYNGFLPCSLPTSTDASTNEMLSLKAFPNPCEHQLTLQLDEFLQSKVKRTLLISESGQLISYHNLFIETLDTRHLIPGYYIVQLEGDHFRTEAKFYKY